MTSELYFQIGFILGCIAMIPIGIFAEPFEPEVIFIGMVVCLTFLVLWPMALPFCIGIFCRRFVK